LAPRPHAASRIRTPRRQFPGALRDEHRGPPRNHAARRPRYFHFSTHDRCTLADPDAVFDGLTWWSAKTGYDNPRRLLLDTCPDCNQLVDIGNEAYRVLNSNPPGLAFAAGSTPLPDHLPDDEEPAYAHHACPGHASNPRT
jgi:hypothetical protein